MSCNCDECKNVEEKMQAFRDAAKDWVHDDKSISALEMLRIMKHHTFTDGSQIEKFTVTFTNKETGSKVVVEI